MNIWSIWERIAKVAFKKLINQIFCKKLIHRALTIYNIVLFPLIMVPAMYYMIERLKDRFGKKPAKITVPVYTNGSNGNGKHIEEVVEA